MYPQPNMRQGQILSFPGYGQNLGQKGPQDSSVYPPAPNQPFDIRNQPADMGVPQMPDQQQIPRSDQPFDIPAGQPQGAASLPPVAADVTDVTPSDQVNRNLQQLGISPFNIGSLPDRTDPNQPVSSGGIQIPRPPGLDTTLHRYPLPAPDDGEDDFNKYMARFPQEHEGIDKQKELLNRIPLHSDPKYRPSLMRKIFGGIAAGLGGGVPAWEYITEGPYNNDIEDFARQFGAANTVATREGQDNATARALVTALLQADTADKRLDIITRYNEGRLGIQQQNADANTLRAQTAAARQRDPRMQTVENRDGMLFRVVNGQIEPVIDPTTGQIMLSRNLTPNDRAEMQIQRLTTQQENALAMERQRQSNRFDILGQQQVNEMQRIQERARLRPANVGADGKPIDATQFKAEIYNRAQEYVRTHPEVEQWFTFGDPSTGDFALATPESQNQTGFFDSFDPQKNTVGLNKARQIYLNIIRGIYGEQEAQEMAANMGIQLPPASRSINVAPPPPTTKQGTVSPARDPFAQPSAIPSPTQPTQPNLTGRRLTVLGPNGQPAGTVDASEASQLPPGYTIAPGQ